MTVKARLEGDVFDLDALVELFAEGEPRVSKESDGYYLASAQLDGLIDDGGRLVQPAPCCCGILPASLAPWTVPSARSP